MIYNSVVNIRRLSNECRPNIFILRNIYLDEDDCVFGIFLPGQRSINRLYIIKGPQLQILLEQLRNEVNNTQQYKHENSFTDKDFCTIAPVTSKQFRELHGFCAHVAEDGSERHVKKKDLLVFLYKLKQALPDTFLKVSFEYLTRQTMNQAISTVRKSLTFHFVRHNLELRSITRDEFITRHITRFANTLYNPEPDLPKTMVCIDDILLNTKKQNFPNFKANLLQTQRSTFTLTNFNRVSGWKCYRNSGYTLCRFPIE